MTNNRKSSCYITQQSSKELGYIHEVFNHHDEN